MPMLYEPARHEPLTATPWNESAAQAAIARIVDDALRSFTPQALWSAHPLDGSGPPDAAHFDLYFGAGGMIWALQHLRDGGAISGDFDFAGTIATLAERNHVALASREQAPGSYLGGDSGLLLLEWQATRAPAVAEALFRAIEANLHHPSLEAHLGSPGSLLASIRMAEWTGEPRWRDQLERGLRILWDAMHFDDELGAWVWTQVMYGRQLCYLGAGHGFVGNIYPVLRGARLLPPNLVAACAERALQTLAATAQREGTCVNWEPIHDTTGTIKPKWLVQDCHGAPGIVCRLADAPRSAAWDALLIGAGEATWQAGPLEKGAGLCHGSAGNGYALLKLWQRSGDGVWLERARAFAMHAIEQVAHSARSTGRTRHSLWTGDIGVALFVWACIEGDPRFPTLDVF